MDDNYEGFWRKQVEDIEHAWDEIMAEVAGGEEEEDEPIVHIRLSMHIPDAVKLCHAARSTTRSFDAIPYLLNVGCGIGFAAYRELTSMGYDPNTGERLK